VGLFGTTTCNRCAERIRTEVLANADLSGIRTCRLIAAQITAGAAANADSLEIMTSKPCAGRPQELVQANVASSAIAICRLRVARNLIEEVAVRADADCLSKMNMSNNDF
jgi:hypothetical protein